MAIIEEYKAALSGSKSSASLMQIEETIIPLSLEKGDVLFDLISYIESLRSSVPTHDRKPSKKASVAQDAAFDSTSDHPSQKVWHLTKKCYFAACKNRNFVAFNENKDHIIAAGFCYLNYTFPLALRVEVMNLLGLLSANPDFATSIIDTVKEHYHSKVAEREYATFIQLTGYITLDVHNADCLDLLGVLLQHFVEVSKKAERGVLKLELARATVKLFARLLSGFPSMLELCQFFFSFSEEALPNQQGTFAQSEALHKEWSSIVGECTLSNSLEELFAISQKWTKKAKHGTIGVQLMAVTLACGPSTLQTSQNVKLFLDHVRQTVLKVELADLRGYLDALVAFLVLYPINETNFADDAIKDTLTVLTGPTILPAVGSDTDVFARLSLAVTCLGAHAPQPFLQRLTRILESSDQGEDLRIVGTHALYAAAALFPAVFEPYLYLFHSLALSLLKLDPEHTSPRVVACTIRVLDLAVSSKIPEHRQATSAVGMLTLHPDNEVSHMALRSLSHHILRDKQPLLAFAVCLEQQGLPLETVMPVSHTSVVIGMRVVRVLNFLLDSLFKASFDEDQTKFPDKLLTARLSIETTLLVWVLHPDVFISQSAARVLWGLSLLSATRTNGDLAPPLPSGLWENLFAPLPCKNITQEEASHFDILTNGNFQNLPSPKTLLSMRQRVCTVLFTLLRYVIATVSSPDFSAHSTSIFGKQELTPSLFQAPTAAMPTPASGKKSEGGVKKSGGEESHSASTAAFPSSHGSLAATGPTPPPSTPLAPPTGLVKSVSVSSFDVDPNEDSAVLAAMNKPSDPIDLSLEETLALILRLTTFFLRTLPESDNPDEKVAFLDTFADLSHRFLRLAESVGMWDLLKCPDFVAAFAQTPPSQVDRFLYAYNQSGSADTARPYTHLHSLVPLTVLLRRSRGASRVSLPVLTQFAHVWVGGKDRLDKEGTLELISHDTRLLEALLLAVAEFALLSSRHILGLSSTAFATSNHASIDPSAASSRMRSKGIDIKVNYVAVLQLLDTINSKYKVVRTSSLGSALVQCLSGICERKINVSDAMGAQQGHALGQSILNTFQTYIHSSNDLRSAEKALSTLLYKNITLFPLYIGKIFPHDLILLNRWASADERQRACAPDGPPAGGSEGDATLGELAPPWFSGLVSLALSRTIVDNVKKFKDSFGVESVLLLILRMLTSPNHLVRLSATRMALALDMKRRNVLQIHSSLGDRDTMPGAVAHEDAALYLQTAQAYSAGVCANHFADIGLPLLRKATEIPAHDVCSYAPLLCPWISQAFSSLPIDEALPLLWKLSLLSSLSTPPSSPSPSLPTPTHSLWLAALGLFPLSPNTHASTNTTPDEQVLQQMITYGFAQLVSFAPPGLVCPTHLLFPTPEGGGSEPVAHTPLANTAFLQSAHLFHCSRVLTHLLSLSSNPGPIFSYCLESMVTPLGAHAPPSDSSTPSAYQRILSSIAAVVATLPRAAVQPSLPRLLTITVATAHSSLLAAIEHSLGLVHYGFNPPLTIDLYTAQQAYIPYGLAPTAPPLLTVGQAPEPLFELVADTLLSAQKDESFEQKLRRVVLAQEKEVQQATVVAVIALLPTLPLCVEMRHALVFLQSIAPSTLPQTAAAPSPILTLLPVFSNILQYALSQGVLARSLAEFGPKLTAWRADHPQSSAAKSASLAGGTSATPLPPAPPTHLPPSLAVLELDCPDEVELVFALLGHILSSCGHYLPATPGLSGPSNMASGLSSAAGSGTVALCSEDGPLLATLLPLVSLALATPSPQVVGPATQCAVQLLRAIVELRLDPSWLLALQTTLAEYLRPTPLYTCYSTPFIPLILCAVTTCAGDVSGVQGILPALLTTNHSLCFLSPTQALHLSFLSNLLTFMLSYSKTPNECYCVRYHEALRQILHSHFQTDQPGRQVVLGVLALDTVLALTAAQLSLAVATLSAIPMLLHLCFQGQAQLPLPFLSSLCYTVVEQRALTLNPLYSKILEDILPLARSLLPPGQVLPPALFLPIPAFTVSHHPFAPPSSPWLQMLAEIGARTVDFSSLSLENTAMMNDNPPPLGHLLESAHTTLVGLAVLERLGIGRAPAKKAVSFAAAEKRPKIARAAHPRGQLDETVIALGDETVLDYENTVIDGGEEARGLDQTVLPQSEDQGESSVGEEDENHDSLPVPSGMAKLKKQSKPAAKATALEGDLVDETCIAHSSDLDSFDDF